MSQDKTSANHFQIDTEDSPIGAVIEFLDSNLPNFSVHYKEKTLVAIINNENDITQVLWKYLELRARKETFIVQFQYNYPESRRSSDLAFILAVDDSNDPFFVIEAKVLPPDRKSREREYVQSDGGGIERYKRGHHGLKLLQSAIVGYIQKNDCSHWYTKINEWINDLINTDTDIHWDSQDLLIETDTFNTTKKYISKNTRIYSITDTIQLHHYLMELS